MRDIWNFQNENAIGFWEKNKTFKMKMQLAYERNIKISKQKCKWLIREILNFQNENAIGFWEKYKTFKTKMQLAYERNIKLSKRKCNWL